MAATGARTRGERWPIATIASLAAGSTLADAARAGGVGERTVSRWKLDPAFLGAVRDYRAEAVERSRAALVAASGAAVEALVDVAGSGPPAARVAAARAILDQVARLEPMPQDSGLTDQERAELLLEEGLAADLDDAIEAVSRSRSVLAGPNAHRWRRF